MIAGRYGISLINKCSTLYHTRLVGSFVRYKVERKQRNSNLQAIMYHFVYDINKPIRMF